MMPPVPSPLPPSHTTTRSPKRHLSMLRSFTLADSLTIGNASCGTIAIFLCLDYLAAANRRFLWMAFLLLPSALFWTCSTDTSHD
jgi:CDP-diacylglycerol--serine O-phosphatidyltransferase